VITPVFYSDRQSKRSKIQKNLHTFCSANLVSLPKNDFWTRNTPTDVESAYFYAYEPSIHLTVSGPIDIDIFPSPAGTTNSDSHSVNVATNFPLGYTLSVSIATNSVGVCTATNQLVGARGTFIPSTTNPWVAGGAANTPLGVKTWGFNLNNSPVNFIAIPDCSTPQVIKSIGGPDLVGQNLTVTYGINADMSLPSDDYSTIIMYTAVPN